MISSIWVKMHRLGGELVPCDQEPPRYAIKPPPVCSCTRRTVVAEFELKKPKKVAAKEAA